MQGNTKYLDIVVIWLKSAVEKKVKYVKSLQRDRRTDRRANARRTKIIRIAHLGIRYGNKRHMGNIGHLNNNSHTNIS